MATQLTQLELNTTFANLLNKLIKIWTAEAAGIEEEDKDEAKEYLRDVRIAKKMVELLNSNNFRKACKLLADFSNYNSEVVEEEIAMCGELEEVVNLTFKSVR